MKISAPPIDMLVLDPVAGRHGDYRVALGDLVDEIVIVGSDGEASRLLEERPFAGLVINIDGVAGSPPPTSVLSIIDGLTGPAVFVIGADASRVSAIGDRIPRSFDFLPSGIALHLLKAKVAGLIEQQQLIREIEALTSAREEDTLASAALLKLVGEQVHRSKNLLAIIQSIALRTMSDRRSMAEAREALLGRLRALSRAYQLLTAAGGKGTEITDILEAEAGDDQHRVIAKGPSARVAASFVQTFALAVHELFQNALQHGALVTPDGAVKVGWTFFETGDDLYLEFAWTENCGQPVEAPEQHGFGLSLVSSLAGATPNAICFTPNGLQCRVRLSQDMLVGT